MICVAVLQNGVGFVEGTTDFCSETRVTGDVDGTEEFSIKVEEAIDIKDEMPEYLTVPDMKTENEVRIWEDGGLGCE
jgi:hypothetical protein